MSTLATQPAPAQPPSARARGGSFLAGVKPLHLSLAAMLYLFFAVFLIWPIVQTVATGFLRKGGGFTLEYVRLIFLDPMLVRGLMNAALVAGATAALALLIALPLASLSIRYDFAGRAILAGLLLVPLVLPPFVGAIGIRMVLSRFGPLTQLVTFFTGSKPLGIDWIGSYRIFGIIVVEALHLYPIMLLNLQASMANVDPAMEQAAANIGASHWRIFRKITLPLIRPGLFAGLTLVVIWSFTELGTPLMFDFYTITPVQMFKQITEVADNPLPYALVVVTLIVSTLMYVVGKVLLGRGFEAAMTKASTASSAKRLTGFKAILAIAPFAVVFFLAVLPHIAVVLTSLCSTGAWYRTILPSSFTASHFGQALMDDLAMSSITRSLEYATLAAGLALIIGLAAAVIIVRSNVPTRGVIDALTMLPLAVPGLVLAFGYLAISIFFKHLWGDRTPAFLDVQEYPLVLLVIAYAARRLPYVVRSAVAGLQQTPRDLELAGANLGGSRFTVLRRITVPLIMANLIAGGLLAFAFAMLEVIDSMILAQRTDYFPITKAIYEIAQRPPDGWYVASAMGVWAMLLLTLTILSANAFLGKRLGAIFRV
jgi:iron(III) transport system permease protein